MNKSDYTTDEVIDMLTRKIKTNQKDLLNPDLHPSDIRLLHKRIQEDQHVLNLIKRIIA